jgi:GNAT superfamily N-acetyltransferase
MAVHVRRATPADAAVIAEFNCFMARETEHRELDAATITSGVAAVLADAAKGYYLVAESDGVVVGQLMITTEWSDWRNGWFWWVQSVYVRQDARRRGVFRSLFDAVILQAQEVGDVVGLRLYVERDNRRAQETYESLGMAATAYQLYERLLR